MGNGWKLRTKESGAHILDQLKDMVAEMRRIPHAQNMSVASVIGETLYIIGLPAPQLLGHCSHGLPFLA